ncbi:unnamed protein product, partial [Rotaria socialis]
MSLNNNHDDSNDDLMIFTMDPLNPNDDDIDDGRTQLKSDLST